MTVGKIDSLNVAISLKELEMILNNREKYYKETVKDIGVFEPRRWVQFEKKLHKHILSASILHTDTGLELPIKCISQLRSKYILEFRGFESYSTKGNNLKEVFKDLQVQLLKGLIHRIDICIDFDYKPYRVLKELEKTRTPFTYGITTYYKTKSENKKNSYYDVAYYDKSKNSQVIHRVEFRFKKAFLKNKTLQEIETVFSRIEKTIKKSTKLTVKIENTLCCE